MGNYTEGKHQMFIYCENCSFHNGKNVPVFISWKSTKRFRFTPTGTKIFNKLITNVREGVRVPMTFDILPSLTFEFLQHVLCYIIGWSQCSRLSPTSALAGHGDILKMWLSDQILGDCKLILTYIMANVNDYIQR